MLEQITHSGEWWVPSNPEKRIKGKLTFNQTDGARLNLEEAFTESPKIIYGISLPDGKDITLQDCFPLTWEIPGFPYEEFKVFAHRVFLGAHFNKSEDVKFNSLNCQMSNFFEWLWKYGIYYESKTSKDVLIKYNRPDTISILINPELRIDIDFRHSFSSKRRNGEVQLKQFAYVSFHPKENKDIDDYLNLMHHFRNFLCLATHVSIFPQEIIGFTDDKLSSKVEVFYQIDTPINTEADVYNSLFTFKDVENKFETCLQNWYTKYDILKPVCQLYVGSLYGRFVYLDLRFLSLVQALEAYHRIAVSNKIYLRIRLEALCEMFSTIINTLITDREHFINKVVDTRNYLTHHNPKLKEKSTEGKELFIITEKLRMMVEMCLLKEIGFNSEEIKNLICKKYQEKLKSYEQ